MCDKLHQILLALHDWFDFVTDVHHPSPSLAGNTNWKSSFKATLKLQEKMVSKTAGPRSGVHVHGNVEGRFLRRKREKKVLK